MSTTPSLGKQELIVFADGSIQPKRSGAGIAICQGAGHLLHVANRLLPVMTNNEAEYAALHLALEHSIRLRAPQVEIRMDSEIVVYQMAGRFAVNSPRLKKMHQAACTLARQIPSVRYTHIPRTLNAIADALATEASAGRRWQLMETRQ